MSFSSVSAHETFHVSDDVINLSGAQGPPVEYAFKCVYFTSRTSCNKTGGGQVRYGEDLVVGLITFSDTNSGLGPTWSIDQHRRWEKTRLTFIVIASSREKKNKPNNRLQLFRTWWVDSPAYPSHPSLISTKNSGSRSTCTGCTLFVCTKEQPPVSAPLRISVAGIMMSRSTQALQSNVSKALEHICLFYIPFIYPQPFVSSSMQNPFSPHDNLWQEKFIATWCTLLESKMLHS